MEAERDNLKPDFSGNKPAEVDEETPPFTGKDLNAVMWFLLKTVGTLEMPIDVLNAAPGPDILKIERQWDGVNKVWRFFVPRKEGKKLSKLFVPRKKKLITELN